MRPARASPRPPSGRRAHRATRPRVALAALLVFVAVARAPLRASAADDAEAAPSAPQCAAASSSAADAASAAAAAPPRAPRRLVAVPDLHGDLAHARRSLQLAGVADAATGDAWTGGPDVDLVQTGDVVDRGPHSIPILDVLDRIAAEAAEVGSTVTQLLGNHELMTLQDDLRYVSRDEIAELGRVALERERLGGEEMGTGYGLRAYFAAGQMRWRRLFRSDGAYGSKLRTERPIAVVRGEGACATLFCHAGLRSKHLDAFDRASDDETAEPNAASREDDSGSEASPLLARLNAAAREASKGDDGRSALTNHPLFGHPDSPLWTRHWSSDREGEPNAAGGSNRFTAAREARLCAELDDVLARVGANRAVVGHTVQARGMNTRCGGRLHLIDVGISDAYVGRGAAWTCETDRSTGEAIVKAAYDGKTVILERGRGGGGGGTEVTETAREGDAGGGDKQKRASMWETIAGSFGAA